MKVMALHELAMAEAPADAVEDAMDAEDPKSALVELLLRQRDAASGSAVGSAAPEAAELAARLRSGDAAQRERAYAALQTAAEGAPPAGPPREEVVALLAALASPMCELLGADAEDVRSEEFRRVSLVLCQMIAVEPVAMMIEVSMKEDQPSWWTALTAENSVVSVARRKDVSELTVEDALNCAAQAAPWMHGTHAQSGFDPILEGSPWSSIETVMVHVLQDEWWGPKFPRPSSLDQAAVNERLALLLMDVLRQPKGEGPERGAVPDENIWFMVMLCMQDWPTVGLACWEAGVLDLALASWREHSPIDFISGARTYEALMVGMPIKEAIEGVQACGRDISAALVDSGWVDCCISAMRAFELQGNTDGMSPNITPAILWPLIIVEGEAYDRVNELIRAAVSTLVFVLENDVAWCTAMNYSSAPFACMVRNRRQASCHSCKARMFLEGDKNVSRNLLADHIRLPRSWPMRLAAKSLATSQSPKTTSIGF